MKKQSRTNSRPMPFHPLRYSREFQTAAVKMTDPRHDNPIAERVII